MSKKFYVYFYYNKDNELLYIGQAKDGVYERWQSHNDIWKSEVFTIGVREYEDAAIMDVFESYYIKRYRTKYNEARLNLGYTTRDLNDTSTLKKYSIDEFSERYSPNQPKENRCSTLEEQIMKRGINVIDVTRIDLFDEELLLNENLDKTWYKYENWYFLFEYADTRYRRKKSEPEEKWISNEKLHSFKKAICEMEKQGLDITPQQHFESEIQAETFVDKCVNFDNLNFKIILVGKYTSGKTYRKRTEEFAVECRKELKIYEEENNNNVYLISSSEFNPRNNYQTINSYYAPRYYTVKDFIEISPHSFIVDLERFVNFYLPNKDKAEKYSYKKINSEEFINHINQINKIANEQRVKHEAEKEEKRQTKNKYFECYKFIKNQDDKTRTFLKKMSGFGFTYNIEETYNLEQIEIIRKKLYGCCTLKQYDYIEKLALKWGLVIKPNVFISKKDANAIINVLKSSNTVNQSDMINKFFDSI